MFLYAKGMKNMNAEIHDLLQNLWWMWAFSIEKKNSNLKFKGKLQLFKHVNKLSSEVRLYYMIKKW